MQSSFCHHPLLSWLLFFLFFLVVHGWMDGRFIQLLCLLGTEKAVCNLLVTAGAFDVMATTLSGHDIHVQLDIVKSISRLIMHRRGEDEIVTDGSGGGDGDAAWSTTAHHPSAVGATRVPLASSSASFRGTLSSSSAMRDHGKRRNNLRTFLRRRNETARVRRFRRCLVTQLAPTLFFKIVANDVEFFADDHRRGGGEEHRHRCQHRRWTSYAHCLLMKLSVDILADIALTEASCYTLSPVSYTHLTLPTIYSV